MGVLDSVRVIIYRVNKKGLEILLVNNGEEENSTWSIPQGVLDQAERSDKLEIIDLDPVEGEDHPLRALAVEGDWHDIPSIRAMVKEDVRIVKDQLKQHFPELEQGAFFAVKEAFKKVMPHEYAALKELKDILTERNLLKYI